MYCKHCGVNVDEGDKFCVNCGGGLEVEENDIESKPTKVGTNDKGTLQKLKEKVMGLEKNKKILIIILCMVIGIGVVSMVIRSNNPETVVKNFVENYSKGNFKEAFENVKIPFGMESDIQEEIMYMTERYYENREGRAELARFKIYSINTLSKDSDRAVLAVAAGVDDEIDTQTVVLVKVNGKWKIDMELSDIF